MEELANFIHSITGVKDNFIGFVGEQLSNIQHSGVECCFISIRIQIRLKKYII